MGKFHLQSVFQPDTILLSNQFIDKYMPRANGEFVKVYIYLLRCLADGTMELGAGKIADRLLCTEGDILRALHYWEDEGLLSLRMSAEGEIEEIDLCSPGTSRTSNITAISTARKTVLSPERVRELKGNEEVAQLLYVAEQYLGKTLSSTETRRLLFFYEDLHMTPELIDYLIEYCVESGHKSIHYIESVAKAWCKEGITTVAMARSHTAVGKKDYYAILRALGISGRNPIESEIRMMDTWMDEYGFSLEVIRDACSRTVLQTGQASFPYTDRILSDWFSSGVRTREDIQVLDKEHQLKRREKTERPVSRVPAQAQAQNRFHNFTQRDNDYREYEKILLNQ